MARTTISLPDDLVARLEPIKNRINVSEVCRLALEQKVITYEQIQATLNDEDAMRGLVTRLKIQKSESRAWSYDAGREDGQSWSIHEASYQDFIEVLDLWDVGSPAHYFFQESQYPFPFEIELAKDIYNSAIEAARECGEVLVHDSYAMGFRDAVREVWEKVKTQI